MRIAVVRNAIAQITATGLQRREMVDVGHGIFPVFPRFVSLDAMHFDSFCSHTCSFMVTIVAVTMITGTMNTVVMFWVIVYRIVISVVEE